MEKNYAIFVNKKLYCLIFWTLIGLGLNFFPFSLRLDKILAILLDWTKSFQSYLTKSFQSYWKMTIRKI